MAALNYRCMGAVVQRCISAWCSGAWCSGAWCGRGALGGPHQVETAPSTGGPQGGHGCTGNKGVGAECPARRGAAKKQRQDAECDRQVTGAENERPYHPHHSPFLQPARRSLGRGGLRRGRDFTRLHCYAFARIRTNPARRTATTAIQAAIIMVCS